jgi:hypothetical protein
MKPPRKTKTRGNGIECIKAHQTAVLAPSLKIIHFEADILFL